MGPEAVLKAKKHKQKVNRSQPVRSQTDPLARPNIVNRCVSPSAFLFLILGVSWR